MFLLFYLRSLLAVVPRLGFISMEDNENGWFEIMPELCRFDWPKATDPNYRVNYYVVEGLVMFKLN